MGLLEHGEGDSSSAPVSLHVVSLLLEKMSELWSNLPHKQTNILLAQQPSQHWNFQ